MIGKDGVEILTEILDADRDTGIEAERTADGDIVYIKTGGTDCGKFSAAGIIDWAKQSGCYVTLSANQTIKLGETKATLAWNTEAFDNQNEFNGTRKTGSADATEANKLHDADGGFVAGDVGKTVWNTTDHTYTTVTGFVDDGELDLADDIMADTNGYHLYFSRFTATNAGKYLAVLGVTIQALDDTQYFSLTLQKNGGTHLRYYFTSPADGSWLSGSMTVKVELAASDYLDTKAYPVGGATELVQSGASSFSVVKLL